MSLRVRFAPSPTGFLHVGGARTALFNWLLARREGGTFVLRIEDTDQARSSDEMTEVILRALRWLGIDWDEGPYLQSAGVERHRAQARRLLADGLAYRDFTTAEELARERREGRESGETHRLARERADAMGSEESEERAAAGEPYAIRFRVPEGTTKWDDEIHGPRLFANRDIDDLVILRSDGTPTYNLAVVSDDAEMGITLVLRGDDHLSNTPKQILLYEALGLPVPRFGHVPLILGPDGRRLSKRHGATSVEEYERMGILPEAMVNFLALLGWSPGDDREVLTRADLMAHFSLDRVLKKSSVFDFEKLQWLNGRYLAEADAREIEGGVSERLIATGKIRSSDLDNRREWYLALIDLLRVRARSIDEVAAQALLYLTEEIEYEPEPVRKHWQKDPGTTAALLEELARRVQEVEWSPGPLESCLRELAEEKGVGAGKIIHPLRLALTGQGASPGIFDVMVALGRDRTIERVERAVRHLRTDRPDQPATE